MRLSSSSAYGPSKTAGWPCTGGSAAPVHLRHAPGKGMALATQCPHCNTTFRVASDQLKLRGGIVRCGACNEVFDGNASLIDLEALAARQAAGAEPASVAPTETAPE